mmetsp:Transcript_17191/g.22328  ORF Transcript_17191/g.22328 Transcript_17191/m.22328 type:complete len:138 (+) Transcript_17191:156-569(+)|eukprot:CAMPEP_0116057194 /NCGR_PEP_ID=MMETSP0322-20121206/4462_1 /TAXON_ID=163516 /ORGANISM="Leptocylindrus danicus var. apora, Strain B651" /LENGTH=137 /DNA_ID=CAMNT_0003541151 /DNA_START=69 /DNA_END=482 /DNA_ORIENTATION=+
MKNSIFEKEEIFVCGFGSEVDTVKSNNAKSWLSLTPGGVDGVPVGMDGVNCGRVLVSVGSLSDELATNVVAEVGRLKKVGSPIVISCASGARASSVAWLYIAKKNGLSSDEVMKQAESEAWISKPPLREWVRKNVGN